MTPPRRLVIAVLVLAFAMSARGAGQSPRNPDASSLPKFPEWMEEFLPRTPEERAKAAVFDSEGSRMLELGSGATLTSCLIGFQFTDEPPPYALFLEKTVCPYDAVVVGTPVPVAVRINNRGTWLYTEHSVRVRRWVRPANQAIANIEVLTSGGILHTEGKATSTVHSGPSLEAGQEYLIFLNRVPGTRGFRLAGRPVSETDHWAANLLPAHLPYELENNDVPFDRFIDDLAIAGDRCRHARRRP